MYWTYGLLQSSLLVCIAIGIFVVGAVIWIAVVLFWRPQQTKIARLYATFDAMAEGLIIVDRELRLLEWNKNYPDIVGLSPKQLTTGMSLEEIFRILIDRGEFGQVDVETEIHRIMENLRATDGFFSHERRRPNGRVVEVRRRAMPTGGFITLFSDVTEQRRAEDQLRQAQKMEAIGHLTGGLAHDFNNLLAVVIGNLELAASALADVNLPRAQDKIGLALDGAKRTAALTQRLLAFARRQTLASQPVDANKVVSALLELMRPSMPGITIDVTLGNRLWRTLVDPNQLESALVNLALNSRDAMPMGGELSIETTNVYLDPVYASAHEEVSSGQYVMVSVSDRGCGMSPEVMNRAYEPFFTTKPFGKGSGLGLSQVFGFAKQSAGHLELESTVGKGTMARLYLPRLHDVTEVDSNIYLSETPSSNDDIILVADQDQELLAFATDCLIAQNRSVIAVTDIASVWRTLERYPETSLLLADMDLPGVTSAGFATRIRRRCRHLTVFYMAAYRSEATNLSGLAREGHKILNKPLSSADLTRVVTGVVDRRVASV